MGLLVVRPTKSDPCCEQNERTPDHDGREPLRIGLVNIGDAGRGGEHDEGDHEGLEQEIGLHAESNHHNHDPQDQDDTDQHRFGIDDRSYERGKREPDDGSADPAQRPFHGCAGAGAEAEPAHGQHRYRQPAQVRPWPPGQDRQSARRAQHGDRDRVRDDVRPSPRFRGSEGTEIFRLRSNGGKTSAAHSAPPPMNNMFHSRYEVVVRSTACPVHGGGAIIMNAI
jgi:hypothetical protein